jgi:hypothetical protein
MNPRPSAPPLQNVRAHRLPMRISPPFFWLALSVASSLRAADEPASERMDRLEQELGSTQAALDAVAERERQLSDELARSQQLHSLAAETEEARVARVQAVDALLQDAATADVALMAGDRPADLLAGMLDETERLRADAGSRSGPLEYDRYSAAGVSLAASRDALADGDWLLARNHLAGAAMELAGARDAAAGNPNRAAQAP